MVLGLVHYLFENCVLPDLRQGCRYRLFALRDRLRKMALNGRVTDDRAYDIVQDSLNNAINAVFVADYYFLTEVRQRAREEKVQAQVRARLDTLAASSDAELQSIHRESVRIFMLSCGMGMGGWLIYLMPITLIIAIVAGRGCLHPFRAGLHRRRRRAFARLDWRVFARELRRESHRRVDPDRLLYRARARSDGDVCFHAVGDPHPVPPLGRCQASD